MTNSGHLAASDFIRSPQVCLLLVIHMKLNMYFIWALLTPRGNLSCQTIPQEVSQICKSFHHHETWRALDSDNDKDPSCTWVLVTILYTKFPIKIAHIPEHFAGYGLKGMVGRGGKEQKLKENLNSILW